MIFRFFIYRSTDILLLFVNFPFMCKYRIAYPEPDQDGQYSLELLDPVSIQISNMNPDS
jgi:hypothetical protein